MAACMPFPSCSQHIAAGVLQDAYLWLALFEVKRVSQAEQQMVVGAFAIELAVLVSLDGGIHDNLTHVRRHVCCFVLSEQGPDVVPHDAVGSQGGQQIVLDGKALRKMTCWPLIRGCGKPHLG